MFPLKNLAHKGIRRPQVLYKFSIRIWYLLFLQMPWHQVCWLQNVGYQSIRKISPNNNAADYTPIFCILFNSSRALAQIMACCMFSAKPLSELVPVIWSLRNKFQWNFDRNSKIFIEQNSIENVIREMVVSLSRPHCVKVSWAISIFCVFNSSPPSTVPQIFVSELGSCKFRLWLVTLSVPSHYLNQCWNIVFCFYLVFFNAGI